MGPLASFQATSLWCLDARFYITFHPKDNDEMLHQNCIILSPVYVLILRLTQKADNSLFNSF